MSSPAQHRRNHALVTVAPAVLVHERFVDRSTPKRCVCHPRVVHSVLPDQRRTRWPLDWAPCQRSRSQSRATTVEAVTSAQHAVAQRMKESTNREVDDCRVPTFVES